MAVISLWMGLVALLWAAVLAKAVRTAKAPRWRVAPEDPPCDPGERVSVVIPARDEAENIGPCVGAVLGQDHAGLEVVVLDDGSTDGTAAHVPVDPRVRVIDGSGAPLPEGWLGKPWACQRAAAQATGDWLLFVDADVRLAPEAVSRFVAYARRHELAALSAFGTLEAGTVAERVLQPVVAGLLLAGNDLDEVNDPSRRDKALANGQLFLFRRDAYHAVGGHSAVAGNVLDDVGMAKALKAHLLPFQLVFARRLFSCRMYRSGAELWRGWRKNLFPGLGWSWRNLVLLVGVQVGVVLAPYAVAVAALAGRASPVDGALALVAVGFLQGTRFYLDGVFGQPRAMGLLTHGLGSLLLTVLLVDSAVSTTLGLATWKGRRLARS